MAVLTRDLVVIEAPGKLRQLYGIVDTIGLRATCIATMGHVLESPPHLRPLEIQRDQNGDYHETRRVAARPAAHARLSEELRKLRGRLFIATDDDQEGHAIAEDVAELARRLRPEVTPLRLLVSAMTESEFRTALARAQPLAVEAARPAIARRIADRTIASAFSCPEDGLIVGRVTAAIAGLARDGALPTRQVTLQIPARDGKGAFSAQTFVRDDEAASALLEAAAGAAPLSPQGLAQPCPLSAPPTHASYLMAMGEGGRLSLSNAAKLLQGLYESGVVSYPRTAGQHYRAETRDRLARMAREYGVSIRAPINNETGYRQGHEPLHVIDPKAIAATNLMKPARLQRDDRSVALAWISRQMFQSLMVVSREFADPLAMPTPLANLRWTRDTGAVPAWHQRARPGVRPLTSEQSLLQGMVSAGIGRPSTYAGHAIRALERDVVAAGSRLGAGGARILGGAPVALSQPSVARALEVELELATDRGVGPTVDRLLALATGRQTELLGQVTKLLQSDPMEEPSYAPAP